MFPTPAVSKAKFTRKSTKKRIVLIRIILLILIMMRRRMRMMMVVSVVYKQSIVGTVVAWGRAPLVEEAAAAEPVGVAGS